MALQIITRAFAERDAAEHAAHGKRSALAERLENSVGVGFNLSGNAIRRPCAQLPDVFSPRSAGVAS
jgi:hypothetical protein